MRSLFYLADWLPCAGVCTCIRVCLAGSTRLGQTSLVPSRWVTWLGGVLACSQWPVWFHYWEVRDTHTYMRELLCCKPHLPCGRGHTDMHDAQTQTDSYKRKYASLHARTRTNAHKHTRTHTHVPIYEVPLNLNQQALYSFITWTCRTSNFLNVYVILCCTIFLQYYADNFCIFYLKTQQLHSSLCFLISVICTHNISIWVLEGIQVRAKTPASMNPLDGGVGLCWPWFLSWWRWDFSLALRAAAQDKASETKQGHVLWFAIICIYY